MIARTSQSRHISRAIPIMPRLHQIPRSTDKTNRTPMVVKREIPMVNHTSPVARSPFPRGSANGKTTAFAILWIRTSQITRCLVCSIKSGMIIRFNCLLEKIVLIAACSSPVRLSAILLSKRQYIKILLYTWCMWITLNHEVIGCLKEMPIEMEHLLL